MDTYSLWQAVLGELELLVSKASFTTWFKNTFVAEQKDSTLIIGVPNGFTKNWLESKYHTNILKAVSEISHGELTRVIYRVESTKNKPSPPLGEIKSIPEVKEIEIISTNQFGLNPKYTFTSFVVGKTNELACAAAKAVAERPGSAYNPLFLYGGVGLGKTHLLQAIGNELIKTKSGLNVFYTTCENFVRDYVNSVRSGFRDNFSEKYRVLDVLLIDDIQFMAGKVESQEFFFHTFNTLHQNNKQLVLSADRRPSEIPTLDDRLQSRLGWGLTADINIPDLETRIAILEAKVREKSHTIPSEIIHYIASMMQHNVRELEAALNKLIAFHNLTNTAITMDSAKDILASNQVKQRTSAITAKMILKTVSQYYDIPIEKIIGQSRKKELVAPRQIVMYLMREEMKASFPGIGSELGKRDHTTVMHAYTKITEGVKNDEKLRQDIHLIKQQLYNS